MFDIIRLEEGSARTLCFRDDTLVDWASGGEVRGLDGTRVPAGVCYSYDFDAAVDCAPFTVLYQRSGTKGLLLEDGRLVRELDRSYYQANAYAYPVALWRTPAGRTLLAHCPREYCQLEIEDAASGERLTASGSRKPDDFFHSNLAVSPGGRRLVSAGWYWHPWSMVRTAVIGEALERPGALDALSGLPTPDGDFGAFEANVCCWQTDDRLIVEETGGEEPGGLAVYDLAAGRCVHRVPLQHPAGPMMAVGLDRVVTFYGHPRLVSLEDGRVLAEWPEVPSGTRASSITLGEEEGLPAIAMDPVGRRFAVGGEESVTVIRL